MHRILLTSLILLGFVSFAPLGVVEAQGNLADEEEADAGFLIVCDGANPSSTDPCGYDDIWELVNKGVRFIIFVSLFISVVVFMWAGFIYLTSGGDKGKVSKAKDMMLNVAKGIIVILVAWIVVAAVLNFLGVKDEYNRLEGVEVEPE